MDRKRKKRKEEKKQGKRDDFEIESDETFADIVGYTSGGTPYGVTWEQWEQFEIAEKEREKANPSPVDVDDDQLPF